MIRRLSEAKRTLATQPPGVTLQDPGLLFFGWQPVIFWTCELPHTGNQLTSVSYRSASNGLSASRADAQAHGPAVRDEDGNENAHHWWCSGSYHCFGRWLGFYPTGFRRGTQLCDCRWPERRRGPGCKRPAPAAPRFRKRRFLTNVNALTVVAAAATFASVAIAQDARVRADRLENDIANGVQTNGVYPAQSRTIWRSPEITPRTWEEQRVAG